VGADEAGGDGRQQTPQLRKYVFTPNPSRLGSEVDEMSDNPLTTARINRTVYDLRHWKLTLFVALCALVFRFLSGRDMRRTERTSRKGRTTDASYFRAASRRPAGWWANLPGIARAWIRLGVLGLLPLWAWAGWVPVALIAAAGTGLMVLAGVRQLRDERHLDRHVRPVWPAVAGVIGVDVEDNPSAWVDVPADITDPDAEITVGLRAADNDDEKRLAHLVTLFSQRLGVDLAGRIDYAGRMVHLRLRPDEPATWPAVADIIGVPPAELACDWMTVTGDPSDKKDTAATIVVRLPNDIVDDEPITESLKTLFNQRCAGEWLIKTDRQARTATSFRKPPTPVPPKRVDLLAEFPVPLIPSQTPREDAAEPTRGQS